MREIVADVDECSNKPCENSGVCVDGIDDFTCQCQPGFTGKKCQTGKLSVVI